MQFVRKQPKFWDKKLKFLETKLKFLDCRDKDMRKETHNFWIIK